MPVAVPLPEFKSVPVPVHVPESEPVLASAFAPLMSYNDSLTVVTTDSCDHRQL